MPQGPEVGLWGSFLRVGDQSAPEVLRARKLGRGWPSGYSLAKSKPGELPPGCICLAQAALTAPATLFSTFAGELHSMKSAIHSTGKGRVPGRGWVSPRPNKWMLD